jgi:hypothetical protein
MSEEMRNSRHCALLTPALRLRLTQLLVPDLGADAGPEDPAAQVVYFALLQGVGAVDPVIAVLGGAPQDAVLLLHCRRRAWCALPVVQRCLRQRQVKGSEGGRQKTHSATEALHSARRFSISVSCTTQSQPCETPLSPRCRTAGTRHGGETRPFGAPSRSLCCWLFVLESKAEQGGKVCARWQLLRQCVSPVQSQRPWRAPRRVRGAQAL